FFTLGTRTALLLKTTLMFTPGTVTTDVPYMEDREQTRIDPYRSLRHVVVVAVPAAHNATLHALQDAKTLAADDIRCVHVERDPEATEKHCREWEAIDPGHPLEIIPSEYRRLAGAMREYIRNITKDGDTIVTVVLAEFIVRRWWHSFLHNGNGNDIK